MKESFSRTSLLIGQKNIEKINNAKIIVFGVGGVGGYLIEALIRCGVENITLVDNDQVSVSNINRQIIALHSTVGRLKTEVMKERILDINPNCQVTTLNIFATKDNISEMKLQQYDYVIDCIDTISTKIAIAQFCDENNIMLISSMGAGNKLDPTKFVVEDIYKTSVCPLAKVMRHELRKRNVRKLKVVYSTEEALTPIEQVSELKNGLKIIPGSISFIPSTCGLIIASEVIKDLCEKEN